MHIKTYLLLIALLISSAQADEKSHLALAKQFEQLSSSQDRQELAKVYANALFRDAGFTPKQLAKVADVMHDFLTSEEYLNKKAKVFMEMYSEEELKMLIELVKSPAYKLMNSKREEYNRRISVVTNGLFQSEKLRKALQKLETSADE